VAISWQHLDDVFLVFAGRSHYLLATDELLQLLELRDNGGRPIVRVIDSERCELMGAVIEPWRCRMPNLAVHARDLWIWRLDDMDRPDWLPSFDLGRDSLSDD
jgi:hypothetical protein